jgi:hypothetical protein
VFFAVAAVVAFGFFFFNPITDQWLYFIIHQEIKNLDLLIYWIK